MGAYKQLLRAFGKIGIRYLSGYTKPLKEELSKSNLNILFEIYVGKMLFFSVLAALNIIFVVMLFFMILGFSFVMSIISGFILGVIAFFIVLTFYHSYPFHLQSTKKHNIETNMPFALNHMGAIASSGVPPFVIFKLMSNVPEYGEIMHECRRIVRNVDVFGMDLTSAVKNVADRTPSERFRQFLFGVVSTVETGGDIRKFLENSAKDALFEYRLIREKYLKTLETYADFYTAVLIAAPLFFVSILSIMSLIGGEIFGLGIGTAMQLGIFVLIPVLNTVFLMFIHYTQPSV